MKWISAGAACLVAVGGMVAVRGQEHSTPRTEEGPAPNTLSRKFFSAAMCGGCHREGNVNGRWPEPLVCQCTESRDWENKDLHREAYRVLHGERAQQMERILGKPVTDKGTGCVSCHGIGDLVDSITKNQRVRLENEGVTCVVCHGADERWIPKHFMDWDGWRAIMQKGESEKYGMTDLWNPVKRTALCTSCHIGDADQGKVVTHEMYAAGHPPLPGIEVATFGNEMPRHWRYIKEKTPEVQKILGFEPGTHHFEETKLVVVSGVASLRDMVRLVARQAEQCARPTGGEAHGLDFALFDCYACHHDLKVPSWRQARPYIGTPGRPQMRQWPTELAKLAAREIRKSPNAGEELNRRMQPLYKAFDAQPFGNCPQIVSASNEVVGWLDQLIAECDKATYDRDTAKRLLVGLCELGQERTPDYDSARQIGWALRTIYGEWKGQDPKNVPAFEALNRELRLDLRQGEKQNVMSKLPQSLQVLNDYNPARFRDNLKQISQLIGQEQSAGR